MPPRNGLGREQLGGGLRGLGPALRTEGSKIDTKVGRDSKLLPHQFIRRSGAGTQATNAFQA